MSVIQSVILLLYAMLIMAMFLDVSLKKMTAKYKVASILGVVCILTADALAKHLLEPASYGILYPLLIQLPVFIGFSLLSRYKGVKVLFVLLSTVIFSAPPVMCMTALHTFYHIGTPIRLLVFLLCCVLMLLITYKFLKRDFNYILEYYESRRFWLFCLIPVLYYIYSFATTKYNFTQSFDANSFFIRQIPTIIVFASYILLVRVFRDTRENRRLQEEQNLTLMELNSMRRYLDELRLSQEKSIVYRHDMRHHLLFLANLAANCEMQKIKDYLADATADIDAISPSRFCENEIVNLILSAFTARSQKENVELSIEAVLPKNITISETELCTLLSNALENAITAAKQIPDKDKRTVRFVCKTEDNKLILLVQNPCFKEVIFENGLPTAEQEGHGFGVKSMISIVDKHRGLYTFNLKDNLFTLRMILTLK